MDLGGYAQIDSLEKILEDNNIKIPRLRGLRLMKNETLMTKESMIDIAKDIGLWRCEGLCRARFHPNSIVYEYSYWTNLIVDKYMIEDENHNAIGIRWNKIHGKKRKMFKYELKKAKRKVFEQYKLFNKYVGRPDVLYIHARIGAGNWGYYNCDEIVKDKSWFLDCIEDAFDRTYVDIYAKIGTPTNFMKEEPALKEE